MLYARGAQPSPSLAPEGRSTDVKRGGGGEGGAKMEHIAVNAINDCKATTTVEVHFHIPCALSF